MFLKYILKKLKFIYLYQVPSTWYEWIAKDIDIDLIQDKYDEEEEETQEGE